MSEEAKLKAWMEKGGYLPQFMRDFHDQKDVFKTIHEIINQNEAANKIGWVDGQIYTIDVFLWFMARRGYTLQRCRKDLPFQDIEADVQAATAHRRDRMTQLLKAQLARAPK
jgi:hypothetical protein